MIDFFLFLLINVEECDIRQHLALLNILKWCAIRARTLFSGCISKRLDQRVTAATGYQICLNFAIWAMPLRVMLLFFNKLGDFLAMSIEVLATFVNLNDSQ